MFAAGDKGGPRRAKKAELGVKITVKAKDHEIVNE